MSDEKLPRNAYQEMERDAAPEVEREIEEAWRDIEDATSRDQELRILRAQRLAGEGGHRKPDECRT